MSKKQVVGFSQNPGTRKLAGTFINQGRYQIGAKRYQDRNKYSKRNQREDQTFTPGWWFVNIVGIGIPVMLCIVDFVVNKS